MHLGLFVLAAGKGVGGPETYEVELARALGGAESPHQFHIYCTSREAVAAFEPCSPRIRCHLLWPRSRWLSVPFCLPAFLIRDRIPLFHATYTPPPFTPSPYVFTHHDNSPFDHPEYYDPVVLARLRPLIRRGLAKARHIICPSEFTRRRTIERFGISPNRISVVPHGVNERYTPLDSAIAREKLQLKYGIDRPFFLFVGKLQGSKNIPRLLEAFGRFCALNSDGPILVLAGKRAVADIDVDDLLSRFNIRSRVMELGYVAEADLPSLYSAARALTFPSIYEGFGLPVIEAMACGTPVLTSSVCALPEVAGDAALIVDPLSVEAIADGLQRLTQDGAYVETLRAKGLRRAATFRWGEHARKTQEVYSAALRPAN